jgi:predicted nucleic acid-binding protein
LNVVDSSGWLEYFADTPNAQPFTEPIEQLESLVVPTIVVYETYKRLLQQQGEQVATHALIAMHQGRIIDLDSSLAVEAARLSTQHRLAMADSVILATARRFEATLWTQDQHFAGLPDVRHFPKK